MSEINYQCRFIHFKNKRTYIVKDTGINAETQEAFVSYFVEATTKEEPKVFFRSVRGFVEDVDRPPEFSIQPRFKPLTIEANIWREKWRDTLKVTVETRKVN